MPTDHVDILFTGPPSPVLPAQFIETEDGQGHGVKFGEWVELPNGWWALRITTADIDLLSPRGLPYTMTGPLNLMHMEPPARGTLSCDVHVWEASAAEPSIWVGIQQRSPYSDGKEPEPYEAQLPLAEARRLRDQLSWLIANHPKAEA